jgi:hypothetical protein
MRDLDLWLALFGVVATIVGGLWAVFVYFDARKSKQVSRKPAPTTRSVASDRGVSTAGNLSVGGDLSVGQLPKGAVLVLLAGMALIAVAVLNIGDRISATRSVLSGGDITGSQISIGRE